LLYIYIYSRLGDARDRLTGAASIRQAWDAIAQGVPVAEHAATHPELHAAIEAFGRRG
jgi:ribulose 1,5-bisphosphate carboxylase large subunit-like protein